MTANDLIAAFETLADAPDGVKRLRELVLQLAVRGKLVAQDPQDEEAGRLLQRITRGRARVEDALRVRKPKPSSAVSGDEAPFELPGTWLWCRLQDVGVVVAGGTPPSGDASNFCDDGGHPWLTPADMRTWTKGKYITRGERNLTEKGLAACSAQLMPAGTVVFSSRAPIGYVAIASNPVATNQGFKSVVPGIDGLGDFLRIYLLYAAPYIDAVAPGTTFKEVSGAFMGPYPCPLPPLAEQHRIVARVDELMGLLDRLETARTARDDVRRAARDAALAALRDAEDTDAVEAAWGRIAGQMDALFAEPEDVGPLRQAVLGLAVRGRLVPQDSRDESAKAFSRRVVAERTRVGGRASKGGSVASHEIPFEVPQTWTWVRFGDIFECRLGKMLDKAKNRGSLHPYLRNANVRWGSFDLSDVLQMRLEEHEVPDVTVRRGDLVICEGGEPGRASVWESEEPFVIQKALHRARPYLVDARYYQIHLRVDCASGRVAELFTGATIQHFTGQVLDKHTVTLPPLPEQHRIVAKVDALMAICDALEARLTTARDLHAQFAAAAVHDFDG